MACADLHSRAEALLRGPCCISPKEGKISAVGLIHRYVRGEFRRDSESLRVLAGCLALARDLANAPEATGGPARDARTFFENAAAILAEIEAEVSAGRL